MPGWWYTIESTTTKHILTQFEHACREALSSDRSTRELMRAKSAKQRFPVIEWIRKLDKLQVTAIGICEHSKKRPATPTKTARGSLQKLNPTSRLSHEQNSPRISLDASIPEIPIVETHTRPHGSAASSRRSSLANSETSHPNEGLLASNNARAATYASYRTASNTSLEDLVDDNSSIEGPELRLGIIEPPRKGSGLSRKFSLGTRLGPGHARLRQRESIATIDSLSSMDDEHHFILPEDEEYIFSVAAIRRQMAKNQEDRPSYHTDAIEMSDSESETPTPDSGSVYEHDLVRAWMDTIDHSHNHFSHIPQEPANVGLGGYTAPEDNNVVPRPELHQRMTYAGGLNRPVTPPPSQPEGSRLSLDSVLSVRDDFALSRVEDTFTDADGKYFNHFSAELDKIDPKRSKDVLCIEEFIMKSEREWSNEVRNKRLRPYSIFGGHKVSTEFSDDQYVISPPESLADEPLFSHKRPTRIQLLLQRRIGDWPVYSFFMALV